MPTSTEFIRLSQVLQFETISASDTLSFNNKPYINFITYLKESYPLVNKHLELTIINNYSLLYHWRGSDSSLLPGLFLAHYDVVPVNEHSSEKWEQPPFSGYIDEQFIWGRGAIDNKFQVMALLEAIEILLENNFSPRHSIYFAFGHDEEIGGELGAAKVADYLKSKNIQFEYIIDEGGAMLEELFPGLHRTVAFIATAEKGDLNIVLSVQDKGGHSSAPPRESAIDILARAITKINNNPMPARLQQPTDEMLKILAPYVDGKTKLAIREKWLFKNKILKELSKNYGTNSLIRTVMSPTIIEGGVKENALPTYASANINVRILQGNNIESVMQYIQKTIKDDRVKLRIKKPCYNASSVTPAKGNIWNTLSKTISFSYPDVVVAPLVSPGTTDSRHFATLGKTILRFSPFSITADNKEKIHGINERIGKREYKQAISFYTSLITNIDHEQYFTRIVK